MKPQPKDIVKVLNNSLGGYCPEKKKFLQIGDQVLVESIESVYIDKKNPTQIVEVIIYKMPNGGFRDYKTNKIHAGLNFLLTSEVQVVGVKCNCNLWAGCSCGAIKREEEIKNA